MYCIRYCDYNHKIYNVITANNIELINLCEVFDNSNMIIEYKVFSVDGRQFTESHFGCGLFDKWVQKFAHEVINNSKE